jgi:hypothetical protein
MPINGVNRTSATAAPRISRRLKLHAIASPTRSRKEIDWEDIRQIVRICGLDPEEETFRALILRYGGEAALQRMCSFHEQN